MRKNQSIPIRSVQSSSIWKGLWTFYRISIRWRRSKRAAEKSLEIISKAAVIGIAAGAVAVVRKEEVVEEAVVVEGGSGETRKILW
jgi:hypothetical protein